MPNRTVLMLLVFCAIRASVAVAAPGDLTLLSIRDGNIDTRNGLNSSADEASISSDGRIVALGWQSPTGPFGTTLQAIVHDRLSGHLELASRGLSGEVGDDHSTDITLSANGRYVAFVSDASNLIRKDSIYQDVFLRDRMAGTTEMISRTYDGRLPNGYSEATAVSGDGRYVAFVSWATNLVPKPGGVGPQVFVRDRLNGTVEQVSVSSDEAPADRTCFGPFISDDGRYVAFSTWARLAFGDRNALPDVYIRDRVLGQTERITNRDDGFAANSWSAVTSMSADARFIGIWSRSSNLVRGDTNRTGDAFLFDRQTRVMERVSVSTSGAQGNDASFNASISDDGRYVAFETWADNLVPGDTNSVSDVLVRDRKEGRTWRISVTGDGRQARYESASPRMSPNGAFVVFSSNSSLLGEPEEESTDQYVYELAGSEEPPPVTFTLKPESVDFGVRPVGSSTTQSLWLRNKSAEPLALTSIQLRGENRAEFVLRHRCSKSVAPGASCAIKLTFAPTSAGAKDARVRVETVDGSLRIRLVEATAQP